MRRAGFVLILLLLTACSAPDDAAPSDREPPPTTSSARGLRVERISADAPRQGGQRPQIVLAPSAAALSREVGLRVPASGEGTYVAAFWGEKATGGHSINVGGGRTRGGRATVRLVLKGPPGDAIVTQVLTYPYVLAVVRGPDVPRDLVFVDQNGRGLDWPVRRVGG